MHQVKLEKIQKMWLSQKRDVTEKINFIFEISDSKLSKITILLVVLWRYGVYSVIGISEGALRILDS